MNRGQLLQLEPNPFIVKPTDDLTSPLSLHLKSSAQSLVLFSVLNPPDCVRVSPLRGRLSPGETSDLTVVLLGSLPVSLQITYSEVPTDTLISEIAAHETKWTNSVNCVIRTATHEELTIDSLRKSRKAKKERTKPETEPQTSSEEQQLQILTQNVEEKRAEAAELRTKLETIKTELANYTGRTEALRAEPRSVPLIVWIGAFTFLLAILKKLLFSRK
jgi:hypothetical protein